MKTGGGCDGGMSERPDVLQGLLMSSVFERGQLGDLKDTTVEDRIRNYY